MLSEVFLINESIVIRDISMIPPLPPFLSGFKYSSLICGTYLRLLSVPSNDFFLMLGLGGKGSGLLGGKGKGSLLRTPVLCVCDLKLGVSIRH